MYISDCNPSMNNPVLIPNNLAVLHRSPCLLPQSPDLLLPISNMCTLSLKAPIYLVAWNIFGTSLQHRGVSSELTLSVWRNSTIVQPGESGNSGVLTKTSIQLIEPVTSFLVAQFHNSHPYQSLNSYRSAISSIHLKTEGFDVSKHLLIHSLMKDTVNKHLPVPSIRQPGLFLTWSLI